MTKRYYRSVVSGQEIDLIIDPTMIRVGTFTKADDLDALDKIVEVRSLSDNTRAYLADQLGHEDLVSYDQILLDREDELRERIDFYSYSTRTENITVLDGGWFTPISVYSYCGEEVGNEVGLSIDELNTTYWKHIEDERHSVIYQLRSYPKKISKIRFRYGGSADIEKLKNIDVHASKGIANIDDAVNILETGINPTWPPGSSVWVEHTLASKKLQARYIKLLFDTAHAGNTMQIREFQVWVEA